MEMWLIESWADFKAFVQADFRSMGQRLSLRTWALDPVARLTWMMRLDEYLLNSGKPLILRAPVRWWFRRLSVRLGFSIGPNIFGPGVAIVHYGLLVIDPTTRIGKNCRIHMGTHIGGAAKFVPAEEAHLHSPRIGDNVYLGPGCKIYGPVIIGDNCVVGANAVVTKSFPEVGLTIAGIPAKVIADDSSGERVIKGAG
ncbi:MAG TPA: DapH/DapD/GlmU-related protein [Sphingomicrobium sp.]|nr:DapH/DapD/GlmU-related protein [Sphingomicrobium sp.]